MADTSGPHAPQHTMLPCPSLFSTVCSNSCPLNWWWHPTNLILSPLLLLSLIFASIRVFSNESALCIRWPKYRGFSLSISHSNEHSVLIALISLLYKGLKSLLQHHNLKKSFLWHSAFFMAQLSHPYMTTGNHSLECMDLCQQSDVCAF